MKVVNLDIDGAFILDYGSANDLRGSFQKSFNKDGYEAAGLKMEIRESYFSVSNKDVIRGMHFQTPPVDHNKIISLISGSVVDVFIDLRKGSKTFSKVGSVRLSGFDGKTVYLPSGVAHGFLSLEDNTVVSYGVSSEYSPENDAGILWSSIDFEWPVAHPIVSERDKSFHSLVEFDSPF